MKPSKWALLFLLAVFILSACQSKTPTLTASVATPGAISYPGPEPTVAVAVQAYPNPANSSNQTLTGESVYPPPSGAAVTVDWAKAKESILGMLVYKVEQTSSLQVTLYMKDGSLLVTTEAAMDDIKKLLSDCGATCVNVELVNK